MKPAILIIPPGGTWIPLGNSLKTYVCVASAQFMVSSVCLSVSWEEEWKDCPIPLSRRGCGFNCDCPPCPEGYVPLVKKTEIEV